ncbi:unnamed protein product, partial [Prorocentrum cordatum]
MWSPEQGWRSVERRLGAAARRRGLFPPRRRDRHHHFSEVRHDVDAVHSAHPALQGRRVQDREHGHPVALPGRHGQGKGQGQGGRWPLRRLADWELNPVHMGKGKGSDLWDDSMLEKDGHGKGKDKDKDKDKGKGKDKDKDKDGKGKDKDKKGKDKKGKDKKGKGKDPEEEKMLRELIAWDGSSWFGSRPTPSVYKTHKMPDSVLWEGGIKEIAHCKCIVVTRNPKDAMISLYRQEHDNSPPTFGGGPIHRAVVRLGRAFHHCLQGSWRAAARLLLEVARRVVEGEGDIPGQRPVDILRGLEEGQPCSG